MNEEAAIERITESENLTDSLEDKDANWLLDWGIGHLHNLIGGITDEDAAGEKVHDLMAVMRKLNQIAGDKAVKAPNELAEDVREFTSLFAKTFGQTQTAAVKADHLVKTADAIKQQPPQDAMQTLINLVSPAASSTPTPQPPPSKPPMPGPGPASAAPNPMLKHGTPTASPTPTPSPSRKSPAPGAVPAVPNKPDKPAVPPAPEPKPAEPNPESPESKDISMSTPGDTDRHDSTLLI